MNRRSGFTLLEMIIVVLVISALVTVAVPNFLQARGKAQTGTCISNLKKIDQAKEQWAMETHAAQGSSVSLPMLLAGYIKGSVYCPANGTYNVQPVGTNPTCTVSGHLVN